MSRPLLPRPRGPLTAWLTGALAQAPHFLGAGPEPLGDPLTSDDEAMALYTCYELSYRGFSGVAEDWEWEPSLLGFRRSLEGRLVAALSTKVGARRGPQVLGPAEVATALDAILARPGRSLSRYMAERGTRRQFEEFAIQRSAYQLKEADPHTWAIPRLYGPAKAALVAIQNDEYGEGNPDLMHSHLFSRTLRALGLCADYGAYLDHIPAVTLSTVNLISLFGMHRRWRGALVGHLAIFEMASVGPNTNYAKGLRRLGFGEDSTEFYDVHVTADEIHQRVARDDMAGQLARQEPEVAADIIFGAEAITVVERLFTEHVLDAWAAGRSSLYDPPDSVRQMDQVRRAS